MVMLEAFELLFHATYFVATSVGVCGGGSVIDGANSFAYSDFSGGNSTCDNGA